MCGIFGIVSPKSSGAPDQNLLDRCTDIMAHRGPDGRGTWLRPGVGLGHRRLAVIDPEGSPQPMNSGDDRFTIVYNGEVYNYLELRRRLEDAGVRFRTGGDTEVVLESFARHGLDALHEFNGMFAFAVWDGAQRTLTLARDRLGVKPLYYACNGTDLAFASEFAPLLELPWVDSSPDPIGVAAFLAHYQPVFGEATIYSGIRALEPGGCLRFGPEGLQRRRWWSLPLVPSREKAEVWGYKRRDDAAEMVAERMRAAVESHLTADVPVGSFLSGGVDSAVVVSLMAQLVPEQVRAYSIGFNEEGYNEFRYSVPLVERLGLKHDLIRLDAGEYLPLMRELVTHKRAPLATPNEVPILALSRHLNGEIKVVLTGEGSDELFGGYAPLLRSPQDFIQAAALASGDGSIPPALEPKVRAALQRLYHRDTFNGIVDHFRTVYAWTTPADRRAILNPDFYRDETEAVLESAWRERFNRLEGLSYYDRYLYILETEHLHGLLTRLDADTMAASVEGRVPFCDNDLVDTVWRMPFAYKLRWISPQHKATATGLNSLEIAERLDVSKYILKRAFAADLPRDILTRRKQAFPVPLQNLLQGETAADLASRTASHPTARRFINTDRFEGWVRETMASGAPMKAWMGLSLGMWLEQTPG